MLDFRIETFLAVCQTMNFTRAAELLHITQPAVSQHIHALEAQYGVRLFVYQGKQLHLTESGRLLYQTAVTMRHDALRLRDALRQADGRRHLRFGATLTVGEYIMPGPLRRLLEQDPARLRDRVLIVAGEDWHPGVIGIVAARLMERYNRPAIAISLHEGEGRGSGRAPDPFDLHGALAACAGHLVRFGGHAAAAGLEIEEEQLPAFRQAVNAWAAEHAPRPKPAALPLDAAVTLEELTLEQVQQLQQLAPFGRENPTPVLLVQDAVIDGVWAMGAEGRHTRVRLRQGRQTLFASLFGVPPQKFAYPVGTPVEAALEVSVFSGRSGPMVSAHLKAIRPAGLGNLPSEQAAWFEALCAGAALDPLRAAALLPRREDTVALYKRIRGGQVFSGDLQPVFAAQGAENAGRTLASLTALQELGLIEEQDGRWLPVQVAQKRDLASAPVLQRLARQAAAQPAEKGENKDGKPESDA